MNFSKKTIFTILFTILGLLALQIPVSKIIGANQSFSLFDFLAPTSGLFLNSLPGAISVLLVKIVDLVINKKVIDWVTLARLLPLPLAAYYFGAKGKSKGLIAAACMLLFVIHPVGREAWVYSLYWLIPIFASFLPKRLFLKSLGATFTAHAIGSVTFLYAFGLPAAVWRGLMPVVFAERISFALGIYASFFIFNWSLNRLAKKLKFEKISFLVKPEYLPSKEFLLRFS